MIEMTTDQAYRGSTQATVTAVTWRHHWRAHPGLATGLLATVAVAEFGIACLVTSAVARALAHPAGVVANVGWWVALAVVSTAALRVTGRLVRRLAPLVVLLRVGLGFPDGGPSRFGLALRAGNPKVLQQRVATMSTTPQHAATTLLEIIANLGRHDRATRGHSERVRAYSELIAEELGLDPHTREQLRWAGLIHDVGKLHTPTAILNKTSRLTEAEWEVIRRHPLDGLRLAAPLRPWLGEHVLAVSDHHERWAGGGYPSGAAGADISLAGRVVCVADAFDVMTSHRSYKRPMPVPAARQELVACSGSQFDPEVVRAFLAISLRKMRPLLGPLSAIALLVNARWILHRVPAAIKSAAMIGLVTASAGGLALRALPVPADRSHGADAGTGLTHDGSTTLPTPAAETGDGIPGDAAPSTRAGASADPAVVRTGAARDPLRRSTAGASEATEAGTATNPARTTTSDGQPATDEPHRGGGPSGGDHSSGAALVLDPQAGSLSVEGGSYASTGGIQLVEAPLIGGVACGQLDVCEPIVVPLPIG